MDKRILISTGVALVFVLAWQFLIQPSFFPAAKPPVEVPAAPSAPAATPAKAEAATPAPAVQDQPETPAVVMESTRHRMTLTNKGAGIAELVLKGQKGGDVVLLSTHAGVAPHFALRLIGGGEKIETLGWELAEKSGHAAVFRYRLASGVELKKTFELDPEGSGPVMKLTLSNPGASPARVVLELLAFNGLDHDSAYRYDQYAAGFASVEKKAKFFPLAQVVAGETSYATSLAAGTAKDREAAFASARENLMQGGPHKTWFGLKNRFFAVAAVADAPTQSTIDQVWFRSVPPAKLPVYEDLQGITVSALIDPANLAAEPKTYSFGIFAGPLRPAVLQELPGGGVDLLNFGGGCAAGCALQVIAGPMVQVVNLVAPIILWAMTFMAGLLGNYGVAIVATTLLIRLCLFPLSKRSQVSMYRMQQLGPKIQVLRDRYKDDKQKFGTEQMKLFRDHKINPLAGCLPVALQMPIFIAMYSVFEMSVELRQAPFILWMKDLSQPDHLGGPWTPVTINILITSFSIDAFNLLPIIMTITWFLQSWYAPRSPDPQMAAQQKMMLFMPVVFGLMCYNLASGLSLYFFVNSLLSMTEQKLIKKFFLKPTVDAPKPA